MKISHRFNPVSALRGGSYAVLASLLVPLAGCGSPAQQTTPQMAPPAMRQPAVRQNTGMSTKQKVVLLAGAAALYYYYQKSKKANEARYAGQSIQYYRSKNGGIYYRDPRTKQAIFVTAPTANYQVRIPESEAQGYAGIQQAQGYAGQQTGNGLDYYFKPGA